MKYCMVGLASERSRRWCNLNLNNIWLSVTKNCTQWIRRTSFNSFNRFDSWTCKWCQTPRKTSATADWMKVCRMSEKEWDRQNKRRGLVISPYITVLSTKGTRQSYIIDARDFQVCKELQLPLKVRRFFKEEKQTSGQIRSSVPSCLSDLRVERSDVEVGDNRGLNIMQNFTVFTSQDIKRLITVKVFTVERVCCIPIFISIH